MPFAAFQLRSSQPLQLDLEDQDHVPPSGPRSLERQSNLKDVVVLLFDLLQVNAHLAEGCFILFGNLDADDTAWILEQPVESLIPDHLQASLHLHEQLDLTLWETCDLGDLTVRHLLLNGQALDHQLRVCADVVEEAAFRIRLGGAPGPGLLCLHGRMLQRATRWTGPQVQCLQALLPKSTLLLLVEVLGRLSGICGHGRGAVHDFLHKLVWCLQPHELHGNKAQQPRVVHRQLPWSTFLMLWPCRN
mmetsp:Transcript_26730/g.63636  ORF Transcript_26730/g.63636 Transcript_26730/m.63636 type:complete len:247 (-) Transcript_26730:1347-2087(-)